jgi:cell division protease FtsH
MLHSRPELIDRMAILLGGRVAEQMVFGEPGSGAGDDLARVGSIARLMVRELGMSDALGALSYGDGTEGNGASTRYSDETARLIDAETRRLVQEAEQRATALLGAEREALDRVAEALVERETLTARELDRIAEEGASQPPGSPPRDRARPLG